MAPKKKPEAEVAPVGMVQVTATARGFDNTASRLVEEGETFYVTPEAAKKGATWFDITDPKVAAKLGVKPAVEEEEEELA